MNVAYGDERLKPADDSGAGLLPNILRAPALTLHLFGGFLLLVDDEPVELAPVAERLVALLALRGRTGRSRIAGTLWPDTPEVKALGCLRTGIWRLNRLASGLIVSSASTVMVSSQVDVDVHRYCSAATTGAHPTDRIRALDVHAVAYEGDLLPDWDEQWLLTDRERLRQIRLHLLEEEAERQARARHFVPALEAAFSALAVDPLRESAHRLIIGIHLAEGNTAEAQRAYQACRSVLINELGVEPSDATRRIMPSVPRALGSVPAPRAGRRAQMSRVASARVPPVSSLR